MTVLVLGADGILGRALMLSRGDVMGTSREYHRMRPWAHPPIIGNVDITKPDSLLHAIEIAKPNVVVNCAGIVKSECDRLGEEVVMATNATAPHTLAEITKGKGIRVVHISTDCVFDGSRGNRLETDRPDATDLYGRSKAAGELVTYDHCVTLRTSFIGRDPLHKRGLVEWMLAEVEAGRREIQGFTRMMWSGLTARELARAINLITFRDAPLGLQGLYHVCGPVISKADLLERLARAYGLSCTITRVDDPRIDRTMYGSRFEAVSGYVPLGWNAMAQELVDGP